MTALGQRRCRSCLWAGLAATKATQCPSCGAQLAPHQIIPLTPYQTREDPDARL